MRKFGIIAGLMMAMLASCSSEQSSTTEYETTEEVLVAMKNRYENSWYETLTFVQTNIQYQLDGRSDTTTWFEAMKLPGKLRIDIGDPESGNTWIFRNDSIYVYSQGSLSVARPTFHPLQLLGFDAYFLDTGTLINKLDSLGFNLAVMSDTTWQGREVYVIGASAGETKSEQFWIDKERLYFVRLLQSVGPDRTSQQDVQFNNYVSLGGGWVAPEVVFYVDGRLQMYEIYHNVPEGVDLDDRLFSPAEWQAADHWFER